VCGSRLSLAFIEKMLSLDEKNKYFLITCGEEKHFAYNRVGYVGYD
jgi:nitrite reductase (NAD(P)H)